MGRAARIMVWGCAGAILLGPILLGLWVSLRASLGVFPALGSVDLTLAPYRALMETPGIWAAMWLSLRTGLVASLISFGLAVTFVAQARGSRLLAPLLAPFLAIPHAAIALGLAFLIAPSGWIMRVIALPFDLQTPPDWPLVNDPAGLALILGLIIKETPFLIIVMAAALSQLPLTRHLRIGASLGYSRPQIWAYVILPQLYPLIRPPVMVVLAYGLSVVDMALILGPNTPPSFAVMVMRLFSAPDLALLMPAFAGAVVQVVLILFALLALIVLERLLAHFGRAALRRGIRRTITVPQPVMALPRLVMGMGLFSILCLGLWSITWRWPWPAPLPTTWSMRLWQSAEWQDALRVSLGIAGASVALSLILALLILEAHGRTARALTPLIYLPLLVPQIGFLFGVNSALLNIGVASGVGGVIWGHILFVCPYMLLLLMDPWRAIPRPLLHCAASLGAGPWRRFFAVKLPLMLRPICIAAAVGFGVSIAQYLPTLFLGGGRVASLTTEAVALASGGDRRITGVYGSLKAAVPLLAYLAAFLIPRTIWRNRRAMREGVV
ncbi:ABC transporter permease subunit [Rhodobacteraceae bacterium XHP0102]|nr:ABC transporter permease subunit [Rhodobacteraceae bacterium XHP0102]